jgi:hypothetical protein
MKAKISTIASISLSTSLWASLWALVAGFGLATCTPSVVVDYCEAACDCEGCSDTEHETCEVVVEGTFEISDDYDCLDDAELLYECLVDRGRCENIGNNDELYTDCDITSGGADCNCSNQRENLSDCIDRASADDIIQSG